MEEATPMRKTILATLIGAMPAAAMVIGALTHQAYAAPTTVYSNDFDSAAILMGGITATLRGAGAPVSSESLPSPFSGDVLLNSTAPPITTIFALTNLPTHTIVDINFDFVFIDSWIH